MTFYANYEVADGRAVPVEIGDQNTHFCASCDREVGRWIHGRVIEFEPFWYDEDDDLYYCEGCW